MMYLIDRNASCYSMIRVGKGSGTALNIWPKAARPANKITINKLRSHAGAQLVGNVDLTVLLDERARELSWEGWRRNDLIRFGQFEVEYPLPNDVLSLNKDVNRRLYPVPSTELKTNPNLVQNPGY